MSKSPNPDIIDKIYFRNIYSCQRKIYWYKVKVMETINAVWEHSYGEDCIPNFSANMEQPRHRWYEFKEGFSLTLVERAIRETKKDNKSTSFTVLDPFSGSGTSPLTALQQHIDDQALIPNSRIAIKPNATVYSYFCNRNLVAIDRIIGILHSHQDSYCYDILELLVSSAINLIKLSDKKASSQMPYWLPQKDVTSRNAVMIIEQKAIAFKEGLIYLSEKCKSLESISV